MINSEDVSVGLSIQTRGGDSALLDLSMIAVARRARPEAMTAEPTAVAIGIAETSESV
jgi:hypothetical protein